MAIHPRVTANATSSEPATEDYQLLLSTNSDRSNAVKLDDQTISGDVYIFLDPEAYVSQVVFSIDGQTHNTENYAPYDLGMPFDSSSLSNGTHTISALVRLQDGTNQSVSAVCAVENGPDDTAVLPIAVTLAASLASPQSVGTVVNFTASGSGGSGSYEYSYWIMGPATGNIQRLVRDYSTSPNFSLDTTGYSGTNTITATVRNVGSTTDFDAYTRLNYSVTEIGSPTAPVFPASSVSLSATQSSPQSVGTVVNFTASGSGGSGSYEYSYWIMGPATGNKWKLIQDYSTSPNFSWNTAGYTGTNTITATVRNVGSTANFEAYTRMAYSVTAVQPASSVSLSATQSSPQSVGTVVNFTASGSGGSGSYEYSYWIMGPATGNKWKLIQDYSTSPNFSWNTAGYTGTNTITATVRNVGSTANFEAYTRMNFTIN